MTVATTCLGQDKLYENPALDTSRNDDLKVKENDRDVLLFDMEWKER